MDTFTAKDVQHLTTLENTWCTSLFLPTHRTGTEIQQDPIRLKNLIREAERQLKTLDPQSAERSNASTAFQPVENLLSDSTFWQHQSDGLAVFLSPDHFATYRVPFKLEESVLVARAFQLKPMLPMITGDGRFYILAFSQNGVRLLHATRDAVDEVDVGQLPASFREALNLDDLDEELQFHSQGPRGGEQAAIYHGHGLGKEVTKELLAKYFRKIDQAVCDFLSDRPAPLVLAGVEYYFPIYRELSRYRQLVDEGIAGSPDETRLEDLHTAAWPLVQPGFDQARQSSLDRFRELHGTGRASSDLRETLLAACDGRVDTLFVVSNRSVWGTFDPGNREFQAAEHADGTNEELTNRAVIETYLKGGTVYSVSPEVLPDEAVVASVFRY